jgi:hypothetical protein
LTDFRVSLAVASNWLKLRITVLAAELAGKSPKAGKNGVPMFSFVGGRVSVSVQESLPQDREPVIVVAPAMPGTDSVNAAPRAIRLADDRRSSFMRNLPDEDAS